MSIRLATPDDLETVVALTGEFLAKRAPMVAFDEDYNRHFFRGALKLDSFVVFLLDDTEGLLVGLRDASIFNSGEIAKEVMWYAREGAGMGGIKLLRHFIAWSREHGCHSVTCGLPEDHSVMERFGFFRFEVQYAHVFAN